MSRKTVTLALRAPFESANGPVSEIVLQEPCGRDFFQLGHPGQWLRTADGAITFVENSDVLRGYAERCIVKPDPLLAMQLMGVLDAIAVRDAIVGFFQEPPANTSLN